MRGYFESVFAEESVGLTVGVVVAELQYKICQKLGKRVALDRGARIRNSNIKNIPTDELASEAWLTKCRYGNRFSLVDCFVFALGKSVGEGGEGGREGVGEAAIILTTDSAFRGLEVEVELLEVL